MSSINILINALDPEECRIAKVKDSKLEEFHIETAGREIIHGNIYKGVITRVEPALQCAFVDYGAERNGFLQKNEIHSDYFQDNPSRDLAIQNIISRGQEMLVQVTKDPIMKKGAMLTTFISLPGRYVVLMPGSQTIGVSRKIEDEAERSRLKAIVEDLKLPEGFGLIVRTAGAECNKTALSQDVRYLLKLWKNIKTKGLDQSAPALLYKEQNLVQRVIRDYFTTDASGILIDHPDIYREVKEQLNLISPRHTKLVKRYQGAKPIFTKYQLENQIASIYESRVELKSGGSIVIESTEALVAIDVNSGKGIHQKSIEQTALHTDVEAAEEIARQLRLRDLGGLIVIDFIDMRDAKNKSEVERAMKTFLKTDKARVKVGKISQFGLMEMSRQRLRPSIEFGGFQACPSCKGKGIIPSKETLGLSFLRKLRLETLKENLVQVTGIVPVEVADYLLNRKRREILDLESRRGLSIIIAGDPALAPGDSKIVSEVRSPEAPQPVRPEG